MKKNENLFTDPVSFRTIDMLRISYMVIAVAFFFLTEIGRNIYRPYIYSNDITDFGIADSIGNSGGIVVQIFFSLAILNSQGRKALHVMVFIVVGYIVYEILQPYLPKGVFDWKDIYGSIIGGVFSLILWIMLTRLIKNREIGRF